TRHLVEAAVSLQQHYYQQEQAGRFTREEAQTQAKAAISQLRYEKEDYFWINDDQPNMIMHPMKPQLNGKSLSAVKDPTGKALFVEMVSVAK
ncbi:cache domain-containing protein, partial [Vibrio vulnificus]